MKPLPKLPPTAIAGPRPLPLLGTTGSFLRFFGDPVGTLLDLHARFGLLATLADRDPAVICAFGEEHNRAVLTDPRLFHNLADSLFDVPPGSAPTRLAHALTGQNGEVHRRSRRLLMPAFQKSALDAYRDDTVEVTRACLDRLTVGATLDVAALMSDLTQRIALRCLFAVEPRADGENLGELAARYLEGLISVGAMAFPFNVPGTPYHRFLRDSTRLEGALRELIDARRSAEGEGRDMLSILLRARDEEDGSRLSDEELMGQATVMFIAGHETTAFTLCWTLLLLAQHPRELEAVSEEVRSVLGDRAPEVADIARLPRVDRALKESQRLLPATPFLFIRRATAGFQLDGHTLPENSSLILSPLITHRLPAVFEDPLRFRPDRWETLTPTPYQYLPFGAGPRTCIGAGFANQALRLVLPMLLQRFRFALRDGATLSTQVRGITMGPAKGLQMSALAPDARVTPARGTRGNLHRLVRFDAPS